MTNQQHSITPNPEQIYLWQNDWKLSSYEPGITEIIYVATQAARWGADQELEACCEFLDDNELCDPNFHKDLRAARRPKPPSLKEQALDALNLIEDKMLGPTIQEKLIRRALEQLSND